MNSLESSDLLPSSSIDIRKISLSACRFGVLTLKEFIYIHNTK